MYESVHVKSRQEIGEDTVCAKSHLSLEIWPTGTQSLHAGI